MRRFEAVTTFSVKGYAQTGRRMVESFDKHWPKEVPLIVYTEGFDLSAGSERIIEACLGEIAWLRDFKARHARRPDAHGRLGRGYDYRFDAVKFAHKTAAVITAGLASHSGDVLIWIDADIVTHAPVTIDYLETLLPTDAAIAWLARARMYPECGFYLLSLRHPAMRYLLSAWRDLYVTDEVLGLPETHDSYVLERVIHNNRVATHSLSGAARDSTHPLARGPLSERFDHLKGKRKCLDHSPEHAILGEGKKRQRLRRLAPERRTSS